MKKLTILIFGLFVICMFLGIVLEESESKEETDASASESISESEVSESLKEETTDIEPIMDWTMFDSIGVDGDAAQEIFTKLGLTSLTDLQPKGTSTINYSLTPFGMEDTPVDIMIEDGKITQVALRRLWVPVDDRDAFFDQGILPETWYYKGEKGFPFSNGSEVGLIMYDIYMYEEAYFIGVNWEQRDLYYFD